ncbi:MAG TPA: very short patch repair endonuclease [Longimicrobium sp.]|nr:very short patch repair endonuclease [Longimicrobium sp.]
MVIEEVEMADVFSREFRSEVMKRVRREGTLDEDMLAEALTNAGIVVGRNDKTLPGSPDLVIKTCRLAVFVDGDFWHGRKWFEQALAPKTNREFWIKRFESNRERDRRVDRQLRQLGWAVTRVWGSDVRRDPRGVATRIKRRVKRLSRTILLEGGE